MSGLQQIEPGAVGHLDIGDDDVELIALEVEASALDVPGRRHLVALASEEDLEELLHAALVVDDEDARLGAHDVTSARGSQIRIVVP